MKTAVIICVGIVLAIALAVAFKSTGVIETKSIIAENTKEKNDDKKGKKKKKDKDKEASGKNEEDQPSGVSIVKSWDVPKELTELSALSYIDEQRFATVQDELGSIFIYNTAQNKIEKEIPFAGKGDYEGLALVGNDAFVLRADGVIFEVKNYRSGKSKAIEHQTHLNRKNDTEGFCYDKAGNRLLVAIKGPESGDKDFKGIYAFDLSSRKMAKEPVYKIDLNHAVFEDVKSKDLNSNMQPSAISIHPKTGDIYITEATKPKLLVMDRTGNIKSLKKLSSSDFNQPEGITFSPDGRMYISNEGNKKPGNILELEAI
ncbi:MAG: hypothetical protein K0S09_2443 [Sphingobacteriaceae bacterium]|jgi:uncharacterized protein YjiK|nr:hypothetical protein [Sphingobacteriaceae bacterium]